MVTGVTVVGYRILDYFSFNGLKKTKGRDLYFFVVKNKKILKRYLNNIQKVLFFISTNSLGK